MLIGSSGGSEESAGASGEDVLGAAMRRSPSVTSTRVTARPSAPARRQRQGLHLPEVENCTSGKDLPRSESILHSERS